MMLNVCLNKFGGGILNLFEFLEVANKVEKDEYGNAYFYDLDYQASSALEIAFGNHLVDLSVDNRDNTIFIDKESYEKSLQYNIIIDKKYSGNARRPYYRLRGKTLIKDQILEFNEKTAELLRAATENSACTEPLHFCSYSSVRGCHFVKYKWIHPDGLVGINSITQKYPTTIELVAEWLRYLMEFPYLNIILLVTKWDEAPQWFWENYPNSQPFYDTSYDKQFYKAISLGIEICDKTIHLMKPKDAIEVYKEYERRYGADRIRYEL